ncbi:MAG TPA: hypothetical protein VJ725_26195 [Thermoanaerobaculia bacterium]|nr:hypothetical protein [Thermoanaerobaculia bacterium]
MDSALDDDREGSLPSPARTFRIAFLALVAVVNGIALWLAWKDRSWGALGIALLYGPIANGALALTSLLAIPFLKARDPFLSVSNHTALSLAIPTVAGLIDAAVILSMDLRGC